MFSSDKWFTYSDELQEEYFENEIPKIRTKIEGEFEHLVSKRQVRSGSFSSFCSACEEVVIGRIIKFADDGSMIIIYPSYLLGGTHTRAGKVKVVLWHS